jgi:Family of unknown function (DUF6338)
VPTSLEGLIVALLAVVPGFLATTTWARAKTWKGPSNDFRTVLQSLAISAVIQVLLLPYSLLVLYPARRQLDSHPLEVSLYLILAVLVLPLAGGRLASWLSDVVFDPRSLGDTGKTRGLLSWGWRPPPPPTIWDWLFTANPPHETFLVIEFDDGRKLAGVFAEGSVALTSPEPQGLFLVREWGLDERGDLSAPVPGSQGLMINSAANIRSIRVLGEGDDAHESEEPKREESGARRDPQRRRLGYREGSDKTPQSRASGAPSQAARDSPETRKVDGEG